MAAPCFDAEGIGGASFSVQPSRSKSNGALSHLLFAMILAMVLVYGKDSM